MGYSHVFGPDIAPDGPTPERANYRQVLLTGRLRAAIDRLNPGIPTAAREDALKQVVDLGIPVLLSANRQFHRLLVAGVPVQYQLNGETRGDLNADVWKAFDQIQTYKEQIPDVFQTNEMLVISDGTEALLGSLSADPERFMAWRTIDGSSLDPLGEFNELQTLVRGVLAPAYLLDYLRYFVLFEDDGGLIKKIAATTSFTPCAWRLARWWRHHDPVAHKKVAWSGTRKAAARAAGLVGESAFGRHCVCHDPEVHARGRRRHVPGAVRAAQHRRDRR